MSDTPAPPQNPIGVITTRSNPTSDSPVCAAIGNFDGVHRGHQYLIDETRRFATRHNLVTGIVLFEPHPRRYFQPNTPAFLLTEPAQRDALLRAHSVEVIHALTFSAALATLSAEQFVHDILLGQLSLKAIVVGDEFRFGKDRAGDAAMLATLAREKNVPVKIITPLAPDSTSVGPPEKIGSSGVRVALEAGDIAGANAMLGHVWTVCGPIIEGQKLGRTLGFPTANMQLGAVIAPRHGVYAVNVTVDGTQWPGIANFGRKPTVGDHTPLLEVHLFDFDGDLYGKTLSVAFHAFLRAEEKFDSLDALKAQISRDCDRARALLD
ncbi:MAG: bifunctional riboflavin kinase/FAD synthetase [Pseudomonadota bacterium]